MTYFKKYKCIFTRFIKEHFNIIEIDDVMLSGFNQNNLPDDLPHTLGGSFAYNDCIEEEYRDFFNKNCVDLFADDIIYVINIYYPNANISKSILKQKIEECFLFSYLDEKINITREKFISLFYNTKIN